MLPDTLPGPNNAANFFFSVGAPEDGPSLYLARGLALLVDDMLYVLSKKAETINNVLAMGDLQKVNDYSTDPTKKITEGLNGISFNPLRSFKDINEVIKELHAARLYIKLPPGMRFQSPDEFHDYVDLYMGLVSVVGMPEFTTLGMKTRGDPLLNLEDNGMLLRFGYRTRAYPTNKEAEVPVTRDSFGQNEASYYDLYTMLVGGMKVDRADEIHEKLAAAVKSVKDNVAEGLVDSFHANYRAVTGGSIGVKKAATAAMSKSGGKRKHEDRDSGEDVGEVPPKKPLEAKIVGDLGPSISITQRRASQADKKATGNLKKKKDTSR